jgi:hypothetical protein
LLSKITRVETAPSRKRALCPQRRTSLWHAENYVFFWDFVIAVIGGAGTILKKFSGFLDISQ